MPSAASRRGKRSGARRQGEVGLPSERQRMPCRLLRQLAPAPAPAPHPTLSPQAGRGRSDAGDPVLHLHLLRCAAEPPRRRRAYRLAQLPRCRNDRRAAHHDRARTVGAEALLQQIGRAVKHAANSLDRHFQRIGGDLREGGLEPLAVGRRADIDRYRAIAFQHQPRSFARA